MQGCPKKQCPAAGLNSWPKVTNPSRNFLLVMKSLQFQYNLGPILHRLTDIAGFLLKTATLPLFHVFVIMATVVGLSKL